MRNSRSPSTLCWCLLAAMCAAGSAEAQDRQAVRLQLKWRHQFQFAGYYAALEQGYYRDAGFDVQIVPATPDTDTISEVVEGRAAFGVASSELALRHAKGAPVVALAVVFQHSPLTLFVRRDPDLASVHDLVGRRVAVSPNEAEMVAYLQREHVPLEKLRLVAHDFSVDSLLDGKVDALAGYETDESWFLRTREGEFAQFAPRSSGVDFYGDTLFTSRDLAARDPEQVEAFRAASLKGWTWALGHAAETAALIHAKYAPDLPVEKLAFEAERMNALVRSDLVEVGHQYEGRWQHIVAVYRELGLVTRDAVDTSTLVYRARQAPDYRWLVWVVTLSLVVLAIAAGLARRFYRLSRRLREQLAENEQLQAELRNLAGTDPLTGLANRRALDALLEREFGRHRRTRGSLTVLFVDVDHFKAYNERYGHAGGDECLAAVAHVLSASLLRPSDVASRYGGEEFVLLLPDTSGSGGSEVAARIVRRMEELARPHAGTELGRVSVSVGVATCVPGEGDVPATLLAAADRALYAAKAAGRNRVERAGASEGRIAG